MILIVKSTLALIIGAGLLAGCGQTGPLYMPKKPPAKPAPSAKPVQPPAIPQIPPTSPTPVVE